RPVFPATPPGPVRPARSLTPARPARRIPVVVAGAEACADGIAESPGADGLVAGTPGFLAEPPGLLVHPPGRLGARSLAAGAGLAARAGTGGGGTALASGRGALFAEPARIMRLTRPVPPLAGILSGLPRLLTSLFLGLLDLLARLVAGLLGLLAHVGGHLPAHPAGLTGRPGQLLAQAPHGLPDVLPDLTDDVADRRGQFLLELVELITAAAQFVAAGFGDPVDLAAVHLVVGDQALFLETGQPGVNRAGGGRVHAHEPVTQQPDYLVAVPGLLIEEPEQVQPEASMAEYRTQLASPSISFSLSGCSSARTSCRPRPARRSSMTRPDMVVTDTCPEPAPRLPLTLRDA